MKFNELLPQVMIQRDREGIRGLSREASRVRCHISTAPFATMPLSAIETIHIIEWTRELSQKNCAGHHSKDKLATATIHRCLSLVSAVMQEALVRGLVKTNPCFGVKLKKRADEKSTKVKWKYFPLDEEIAIATCEAIPRAARLAILFALYTGLRQGEQCNLEMPDLFLDGPNPRVTVRYGAPGHLPPKNGKVEDVPLIPQAIEVCREWLALLPTFAPENPHNLVFPTARGKRRQQGKPLGRSSTFKEYLTLAGVPHARWHDLRHGCASALIGGWWGRKWPITEVRGMLRHSSVTVTERYATLAGSVLQEAARATVIQPAPASAPREEAVVAVDVPPEVMPEPARPAAAGGFLARAFSRMKGVIRAAS